MKHIELEFNETINVTEPITKIEYKSGNKTKRNNKPTKEIIHKIGTNKSQTITKERTESGTDVFHEGVVLKNGKEHVHKKHKK